MVSDAADSIESIRYWSVMVGLKFFEAGCLKGCPWFLIIDSLLWLLESAELFVKIFKAVLGKTASSKLSDTM